MPLEIIALVVGLVPALIATARLDGDWRVFVGWWVFGAVLFVVALPVSILVKKPAGSR